MALGRAEDEVLRSSIKINAFEWRLNTLSLSLLINRGDMELTQVLEATLSPDSQTIRLAEEQLQKAAQTNLVWHTHTHTP